MIWLIGCNGMLGQEVARQLNENKFHWVGTDKEVDITNPDALEDFERKNETSSYEISNLSHSDRQIKWIINCSAYTNVEKAEEDVELAEKINTVGPRNIDLILLCLQDIGVILFIEVCGAQGEGSRVGIRAFAGAVHTQKDVDFTGRGRSRDGRGDPVLLQHLVKIRLGGVVDAGFVHNIHLLAQHELGAVVSNVSYDRVNVVGFFALRLCRCGKRHAGNGQDDAKHDA